jgi:acyl-CoA thioester hydrolase
MSYRAEFRVRYHECDAYGHLNNVSYVRYLEGAALEADSASGSADAREQANQASQSATWQTRRLNIEYLRPARYTETIEVTVVTAATSPGTLRRSFDFRLAGSPALEAAESICRAETEASPCEGRVPPASKGVPANAHSNNDPLPALEPLPPLPPQPAGVFSLRRRVLWNDLDLSRRVSDAALLSFTDACGMEVIATHGWPAERMAAAGFAVILRSHAAEFYERPVLGDEIVISTWASGVRRVSALRHYIITRARDGSSLARIDTLGVWVELATGRPIPIPAGFMDSFANNVV